MTQDHLPQAEASSAESDSLTVAKRTRFSVVVRTYNESRYLPSLLLSLSQQDVANGEMEVVVVDSGSTDSTLEIAIKAQCRIVHIPKAEFSFGRSLNVGCNAAHGDYLIFISGHCVPESSTWLRELTNPLVEGRASITYGRQVGGAETKFSEHQLFEKYFPSENSPAINPYFCNNANAAVLKSVWADNFFDEEVPGLEDMVLGRRVVEAGGKIEYVPTASVFHYHRESWAQVKRRYEREAIALQKILPSMRVSFSDAVRYFMAGILGDSAKAISQRCFLKNACGIFAFRFCQYWGTWRGNNLHHRVSKKMKEQYFYPHRRR